MSYPKIPMEQGQRWEYIGPGEGKGPHTVISCCSSEVITWQTNKGPTAPGYSWIGPVDEFVKCFKRIPQS